LQWISTLAPPGRNHQLRPTMTGSC
jgi:hypothetical protein